MKLVGVNFRPMAFFSRGASLYIFVLISGLAAGYFFVRLPHILEKHYEEGDYSSLFAASGARVMIIGNRGCSFCIRAREYFERRHVAYVFEDVASSRGAAEKLASVGGGGVPMVVIGNRCIKGFWPDEFEAALRLVGL